jgi:hypothetical protein
MYVTNLAYMTALVVLAKVVAAELERYTLKVRTIEEVCSSRAPLLVPSSIREPYRVLPSVLLATLLMVMPEVEVTAPAEMELTVFIRML